MAENKKTNKVKARKVANSRTKSSSAVRSISPLDFAAVSKGKVRRSTEITLEACAAANLRPLKCADYDISLNPDFGFLTVKPKPNTTATAEKWRDCFGMLGHNFDCVAKLSKSLTLTLNRPVCLECSAKRIVFSFWLPRKPVVSIE
jgi:hypothetical protein